MPKLKKQPLLVDFTLTMQNNFRERAFTHKVTVSIDTAIRMAMAYLHDTQLTTGGLASSLRMGYRISEVIEQLNVRITLSLKINNNSTT